MKIYKISINVIRIFNNKYQSNYYFLIILITIFFQSKILIRVFEFRHE